MKVFLKNVTTFTRESNHVFTNGKFITVVDVSETWLNYATHDRLYRG